jgi:hypothetical protein
MGKKEELSEQIRYLTELLKLTWLSLLAVGGGTVGLVLGDLTLYRKFAAGAGLLLVTILVLVLGYLHRRTRTEIRGLREI